MNFDFIFDPDTQMLYLRGLWLTIKLLCCCIAISFVVAIPLAVARNSSNQWLRYPVQAYSYVIRGTPLLLQLYLIYFGLSQFESIRNSAAWFALSNPLFCTLLAFIINETAYAAEIFAGAMRHLPVGQMEAGTSYGMSKATLLRRIVLPAALRHSLPSYSNEVIIMLHSTSLAATVTLMDLTGAANDVYSTLYLPFEAFMVAAVFYLLLTLCIVGVFRAAERRFLAHQRPLNSLAKPRISTL